MAVCLNIEHGYLALEAPYLGVVSPGHCGCLLSPRVRIDMSCAGDILVDIFRKSIVQPFHPTQVPPTHVEWEM